MKMIDLSKSFDGVVTSALALPEESAEGRIHDETVVEAARRLYRAAHGRGVETAIGLIPIAPATAPFLKKKPIPLRNRREFLALAEGKNGFNGSASPKGDATGS